MPRALNSLCINNLSTDQRRSRRAGSRIFANGCANGGANGRTSGGTCGGTTMQPWQRLLAACALRAAAAAFGLDRWL